jgi:hypothetical protein
MKNNKWLALIILITPIVVLSLSTLTFYFGYKPDSSSNNGELIYPHIETDGVRLKEISGEPFSFKKGKWYLIYFDNLESVSESEETYKLLFSLNTTLGREMNRVKRVVVLENKITSTKQKELIEKFPSTFFLVDTDRILESKISANRPNPYDSRSIYLSDDFSNIMEEFKTDLEFKEIFEDLKTLL